MDLPRQFGKYELLEHLATGGMAEVFVARSFGVEGFQKRVVIKRILPGLAQDPRFVGMFIKEARITAGLTHPNIVQIFELGKAGPDHYIAMEHLHGRDLARIMRALRAEERRMPLPLAVFVVASLLRGLGYAHTLTDGHGQPLNLVHRDVSPHNVLVSYQGEVKLLDFGIARLASQEDQKKGAVGGGKYAYMSPEQAAGLPLDPRSDIFSAGIVLYELLVGRRLFQDEDPDEKLRKVREAIVPDPRAENPEIPADLAALLLRMLARDPGDRCARAEQIEEDLWAFLYAHGMRADAAGLRAFMQDLFPEDARSGAAVDLAGLVSDVRRMDRESDEDASGSSAAPGSASLPDATGSSASGTSSRPEASSAGSAQPTPLALRMAPGESRPVVVLVAEVCGLTDPSAHQEPAETVRHHYALLRRVRRVVDRYGGLLESFRDGSLIVLFGIDRAREDDAERALACASSLQRLAARLARRGLPVALAAAVHQGELTIGRRSRRELRYLARGDTMKLARRLCAEADLGEVLVSERAAALAGGAFRFEPRPPVRLKGHAAPVACARLGGRRRGLHGEDHREDLPPEGGRWLRRGEELDRLQAAFQALQGGQSGVFAITGEAGAGKSRLLREVARLARKHKVPFFSSRALPYASDVPLAPIRDLLAGILGIEHDDDRRTVRERLARLSQLRVGDADQRLMSALFGLAGPGPRTSPEDMQRAAAVLVKRLAEDEPLILAIEDVQHLAPLGLQLVAHVLQAAADAPVLFLATARDALPEALGQPRWSVELGALPAEMQGALAAEVADAASVDLDLIRLIERSAEGNPLYITLLVRSLLQQGRIQVQEGRARLAGSPAGASAGRWPLRTGLEGLIAARIDALSAGARGFLQVAAIAGLTFSPALVAEAAGVALAPLPELEDQGLIEPAGDGRFAFASPLLWEVVRRSIVGARLRDLHRAVAEGMLRHYCDRLDPHRLALAQHLAAAGRRVEAARHALQAGEHLASQHLLEDALGTWEEGIAWAEEAADDHAVQAISALLRLRAGAAASLLGRAPRAERHLLLAQELAVEQADIELEAHVSLEMGRLFRGGGKPEMAAAHLEDALHLAHAGTLVGTDGASWRQRVAVEALEAMGQLAQDAGEDDEAESRFQLALRMAGGDPGLEARALVGLANRRIRSGETDAALELLQRARQQASGDRILLGRILNNMGAAYHGARSYEPALECFRDAVEIRQGLAYRRGVVVNYHNIGDTYLRLGDVGRAWASFQRSRDLAREMVWEEGETMNEVFLAFVEGLPREEASDPGADLARMEAAARQAEGGGDLELTITARWLLGRLLLAHHRPDEARVALATARELAEEIGARTLIRDLDDTAAEHGLG